MNYIGELAALATSIFFAATSTQFTFAGREIGSVVVNRTRLILAVIILTTVHLVFQIDLPTYITYQRLFWLSLSGIIGLVLGDAFLFQAFIMIGTRLSMLLMSLTPIMATTLAWVFLGERLNFGQLFGIILTISGIAWVVFERNNELKSNRLDSRKYTIGILFGIAAALGQAGGLITAKLGLDGDFPAISGTLIRMLAAMIVLWSFTLLRGQGKATFQKLRDHPRARIFLLGGSITGPFLGVTASLLAIQLTDIGIASTLMALTPIFLLPVGHYIFHERIGWQAIAGTLVAIAGVAILFLV